MKAGQIATEELIDLLENGDDRTSWDAACNLMRAPRGYLKAGRFRVPLAHGSWGALVDRTVDIARSTAGFTKVNAIYVLGKLFPRVDNREEVLDTLLLTARDSDANVRRASVFALADCISDDTKSKIVGVFEDLLADEAKTVRFAALEVLTEALPHRIGEGTLDRIMEFLEADEVSIRWRAALAIDKAYPGLNVEDKVTAIGVLRQAIESEDIFVKVRAYQALFNIRDSEARGFPEVDAVLERESEFVRLWAHYDDDLR